MLVGEEEKDEEERQQQQQQQQHTPPKRGEARSGLMENKCSPQQTGEAVTRQLMANMVLLGATRLEELVNSKPPQEVKEFSYLVIYGCQLSPAYPLKLLKLCIDFNEGFLTFWELFNLPPCAGSGAFIDIILYYVFESLKMCST